MKWTERHPLDTKHDPNKTIKQSRAEAVTAKRRNHPKADGR